MQDTCNNCQKASANLKRCAKCSTTPYCSRDCQKADWKAHKKICGKQAHEHSGAGSGPSASAGATLSPPKGLEKPITKPFTRIDNHTYLHDRPEEDVYRVLIDAYRLRADDENKFEGRAPADSLYGSAESGIAGFREFLRQAASRPGLLPPWWDAEKEEACKDFGMNKKHWQDLHRRADKSDIIGHYGDPRFPMQLRMFAEIVIGRGFAGNNGSSTRRVLMMMEGGGSDAPGIATMFDMSSGNASTFRR
ncbi:putative MYND domain protein [Nemania abortiva]|nr:putative MYND domain protein [Nemania abortiva]